jgi:hypothetical protein
MYSIILILSPLDPPGLAALEIPRSTRRDFPQPQPQPQPQPISYSPYSPK